MYKLPDTVSGFYFDAILLILSIWADTVVIDPLAVFPWDSQPSTDQKK